MTSRKTKWTAYLLVCLPFAENFWQVIRYTSYCKDVVNWWIALDYPYGLEWYIHDAGIYVSNVLQAWAIFRLSAKIGLLHRIALVLLISRCAQLLLYFTIFDWFPATVVLAVMIVLSAFMFIRSHRDNPHTVVRPGDN